MELVVLHALCAVVGLLALYALSLIVVAAPLPEADSTRNSKEPMLAAASAAPPKLLSGAFQSRLERLAAEVAGVKPPAVEIPVTTATESISETASRVGRTISLAAEGGMVSLCRSFSFTGEQEATTPRPRGLSTRRVSSVVEWQAAKREVALQESFESPEELEEMHAIDTPDNAHRWMAIEAGSWSVRGSGYLRDKKKVPSANGSQLLAVELFRAAAAVTNAAGRPGAPTKLLGARCATPLESIFVVNLMLPRKGGSLHVVLYFGVFAVAEGTAQPAATLRRRFLEGDDASRDAKIKLISRVVEGPFLVRMAVPAKPAITGKTVPQHHSRGPGYFEVALDVTKDRTAARVLSVVAPASKALVIDVCFLLEGTQPDELPEMVLGSGRLSRIDLSDERVPQVSTLGG